MATARFVLRMLPGIDRPAISSELPNANGTTCMLDLGANADCTPEQLLQFGIMGSILTNVLHKKNNPLIGLLSNGSESMKGSEVVKKSAELFRNSHLNFHGNVEGDDIFKGTTDVVVCDGFTGNISLKTTEGLAQMMANFLTLEFKRNFLTKISALIAILAASYAKSLVNSSSATICLFLIPVLVVIHSSVVSSVDSSSALVKTFLGR